MLARNRSHYIACNFCELVAFWYSRMWAQSHHAYVLLRHTAKKRTYMESLVHLLISQRIVIFIAALNVEWKSCNNNSIWVLFFLLRPCVSDIKWFILHKRRHVWMLFTWTSFTEKLQKKNKNGETNKSPLAKHRGNVCSRVGYCILQMKLK